MVECLWLLSWDVLKRVCISATLDSVSEASHVVLSLDFSCHLKLCLRSYLLARESILRISKVLELPHLLLICIVHILLSNTRNHNILSTSSSTHLVWNTRADLSAILLHLLGHWSIISHYLYLAAGHNVHIGAFFALLLHLSRKAWWLSVRIESLSSTTQRVFRIISSMIETRLIVGQWQLLTRASDASKAFSSLDVLLEIGLGKVVLHLRATCSLRNDDASILLLDSCRCKILRLTRRSLHDALVSSFQIALIVVLPTLSS